MSASGIPLGADGQPIRNDPGAIVVRAYRIMDDGVTHVDIGGLLVRPDLVEQVATIGAALAGVTGAELVKIIMREVYGHDGTRPPGPPAPPADPMADFLREMGNAHDDPTT